MMSRNAADLNLFDQEVFSKEPPKKSSPKTKVGDDTEDKEKLRVLAALVFSGFGGNVTVKEVEGGNLGITTLAGNKWRIAIEKDAVVVSGYPNLQNYSQYVGKLKDANLLKNLVDISHRVVQEVQEAEKEEPQAPPISYEGLPGPFDQQALSPEPSGLIPAPGAPAPGAPAPFQNQPGMGFDQGMPGAVPPIPPPPIMGGPEEPIPPPMPGPPLAAGKRRKRKGA